MPEAATSRNADAGVAGAGMASRPELGVVPEADGDAPPAAREEPSVARAGLIGYAIGFTVVCAAITIIGTIRGVGFGASLGLGAYVGLWGGGGFGWMVGATIALGRYLETNGGRSPSP